MDCIEPAAIHLNGSFKFARTGSIKSGVPAALLNKLVMSRDHSAPLLLDESRKYDVTDRHGLKQIDAPSGENSFPVFAEFVEDHVHRLGREYSG